MAYYQKTFRQIRQLERLTWNNNSEHRMGLPDILAATGWSERHFYVVHGKQQEIRATEWVRWDEDGREGDPPPKPIVRTPGEFDPASRQWSYYYTADPSDDEIRTYVALRRIQKSLRHAHQGAVLTDSLTALFPTLPRHVQKDVMAAAADLSAAESRLGRAIARL